MGREKVEKSRVVNNRICKIKPCGKYEMGRKSFIRTVVEEV